MVLFKGEITMPEKKFDKNKYDQQFHKKNYRRFSILFRNESDYEMIQKLESQPNSTDYLRHLIRADIEREKQASRNSEDE